MFRQQSFGDIANSTTFIDLPGFTHIRFGTHDRSDHFALPKLTTSMGKRSSPISERWHQ